MSFELHPPSPFAAQSTHACPLPCHAPWRDKPWLPALGQRFGSCVATRGMPSPKWVARNEALAREIGIATWLNSDVALPCLSGNVGMDASRSLPFASVYSGHQFGVWAGQLGDGRAHLIGEVDGPNGPIELQLKGAGLTPYSRMGDGRAVLRSSIREYLASEAMHALGIPTTRALALTASPLPVRRETTETAAIVTRAAPSFLRFGHFEHFTHTMRDVDALRVLCDATMERFFPELMSLDDRYLALLATVSERTAALIAAWQAVGFCHGVMNTDNMSILGLTIDYGPFGFLDAYDPAHVCNHSDENGRYAYARQPGVGLWNLSALAHALMPLINDMAAVRSVLDAYTGHFARALLDRFRNKLGLDPGDRADDDHDDIALIDDWLTLLAQGRVDFTIAHRRLGESVETLRDLFIDRAGFDAWHARLARRCPSINGSREAVDERRTQLHRVNPKFVLRNHLAHTVIDDAERGDFAGVERLHRVLSQPFDEQPEHAAYADFAPDWASTLEVSCSS